MMLPIDASTWPFKPKYLDEETPMFSVWMAWGKGTVSSPDEDIFTNLTDNQVKSMLECRRKFIAEIFDILSNKT